MKDQQPTAGASRDMILRSLRELIEALDRRVPHVERLGEAQIAHDAAALKRKALERIEQLTAEESNRHVSEAEVANAIMTDDGGPPL